MVSPSTKETSEVGGDIMCGVYDVIAGTKRFLVS